MSDVFWDIAVSYPALCFVAVVLLAALIVGYFPLLKYLPVLGPYVPVARLAAFLAVGLLCFLVGFRISDEREAAKNLKSELAAKTVDLQAANDAYEQSAMERTELANQAKADQERIAGYETVLKDRPSGGCELTADDLRWLRINRSGR